MLKVWGDVPHRPDHETEDKRPLGGVLSSRGETRYSTNMARQPNSWQPNRLAKQLHIIARKLDIGHCHDCKIKATEHNFVIFQFDHLDRATKTAKIADMVKGTYTMHDIDLEIAKCQMVCGNCHALRTYYNRDHDTLKTPKQQLPGLFDEPHK
jgi:hypothetical protein